MITKTVIKKDKTVIKDVEMIEEIEMTEEFLKEPYYKYDSFDLDKVEKVALELGFRKNTQKLADALKIVVWIERKLQKLGKMQSKTVEYDLEPFGFEGKGEMLVFGQCVTLFTSVIANDLDISFYRAKKAKDLLSQIGLINFLKTIKTSEGKFLKLWVVELEYYGNEINEVAYDISDISSEEAELIENILEENADQLALLDFDTDENDDTTDENDDNIENFDDFNNLSDIVSNNSFADIVSITDISINEKGVVKVKKENKEFEVSLDTAEDLKLIDDFYDDYLMKKFEKLFSITVAEKSGLS